MTEDPDFFKTFNVNRLRQSVMEKARITYAEEDFSKVIVDFKLG